jgi:hypothetical protein
MQISIYNSLSTVHTWPLSVQACSADYVLFQLKLRTSISESSVIWTIVSLTDAKFKPLIFPMLGFALPYIVNVWIIMILYFKAEARLHNIQ